MKFRTEIEITSLGVKISYENRVLALGSCFAAHIARKLAGAKFRVAENPSGILFNPLSIAAAIRSYADPAPVTRGELGFDGEVWHHFGFHGDFSAPTADEALQKMNAARQTGADALRTADRIVLTFGTAWVYERQGEAVANCHRRPAAEFSKRRLSVEEIVTLSRLSRPTVLNILKELDTRGLIYRAGLGESMGGRQPIMYTLNLRRYFAVGVDLEYPPVRVAFSDLREKVLYSQEWDCLPGETMEDIEGIANLYEFDGGPLSGWVYSVNGVFPNYGSSKYALKDGDQVLWQYTCDLGADVGGDNGAWS